MMHPDRHDLPNTSTMRSLSLLLALSLSLAACSAKEKNPPRGGEAIPVTAAQAVLKDVPLQVKAVGHVEAFSTVTVKSLVGGELMRIRFQEGQTVAKGDLLFEIDPRPYQADLEAAEARRDRDLAQARKAAEDVKRYEELVKKDYVTREQYNAIVANAESLEATVKADEAAVQSARLNLGYCGISAPISGKTGTLLVHAGNLVKANDAGLVVLNQIRPAYVAFAVPEEHLPAIQRGIREKTISVQAVIPGEDGTETGTLSFLDNAVDPATGTLSLKALFNNAGERLWPGQFVDVALTLGTAKGVTVVPGEAVQRGQQGSFVYVVKADQTVELRPVKPGISLDGFITIESGVTPGETVVIDGQLRLTPGARISLPQGR